MHPELVFNMAKSDGNALSYIETESVIYGFSVAGKLVKDIRQIDNISKA